MPALNERELARQAQRAGLIVDWTDAFGKPQRVAPDTVRALLDALHIDGASALDASFLAPLVPVDAGRPALHGLPKLLRKVRRARIELEFGGTRDCTVAFDSEHDTLTLDCELPPGYHALELGGARLTLAAAPARCFTVADAAQSNRARCWGLAAQVYALRARDDLGIGHFGAVGAFAAAAARRGAAALALSPVHAMFYADAGKYSPYSPSNRCLLNVLHADPATLTGARVLAEICRAERLDAELRTLRKAKTIDWQRSAAAHRTLFEALFRRFAAGQLGGAAEFAEFRHNGGGALAAHASFEALSEYLLRHHGNLQHMPATLRDAQSSGTRAYTHTHHERVVFHAFLQWCAHRSLAAAQREARAAGMPIGLIADLAVGVDPAGSECWSRHEEMLPAARIGAPPDQLNALGQNWGLTTFSPFALVRTGYAAFLDLLRATMRNAGGVRLDHVMSLVRLWLIPAGAGAREGAYLRYPFADLLRLIALESWRHRCIVIGEDLGTVPPECRARLARNGVLGIDVLPFMREKNNFVEPKRWRRSAIAMTSTHDLATVAGWWQARDLDWRSKLALFGDSDEASERAQRDVEREQLRDAFARADARLPARAQPERIADAAIQFVAASPAPLAIVPVEDITATVEQPNLPGTIEQHPNWRSRYAAEGDALLARPNVAARARRLSRSRGIAR
jgi:4-alpha-glucanotransferase